MSPKVSPSIKRILRLSDADAELLEDILPPGETITEDDFFLWSTGIPLAILDAVTQQPRMHEQGIDSLLSILFVLILHGWDFEEIVTHVEGNSEQSVAKVLGGLIENTDELHTQTKVCDPWASMTVDGVDIPLSTVKKLTQTDVFNTYRFAAECHCSYGRDLSDMAYTNYAGTVFESILSQVSRGKTSFLADISVEFPTAVVSSSASVNLEKNTAWWEHSGVPYLIDNVQSHQGHPCVLRIEVYDYSRRAEIIEEGKSYRPPVKMVGMWTCLIPKMEWTALSVAEIDTVSHMSPETGELIVPRMDIECCTVRNVFARGWDTAILTD